MPLLGPYRSKRPMLPLVTVVSSRPGLLPRTMSESTALLQPWFVLMSMVPVTIKDSEDRIAELDPLFISCSIREN